MDTPTEASFDDIVKLAAVICEVPLATVTLIDEHRQWFKACVGMPYRESPRETAFCSWAVAQNSLLVIEDARQDPRYADYPGVQGPPFLVFYAGAIVRSPSGKPLGTVCVLDHEPRKLNPMQLACLEALARQAGALVASRIDNIRLEEYAQQLLTTQQLLEQRSQDLETANCQLEMLANTDGLTGLLNRRCLMQRAEKAAQSASLEAPMVVLLADVDYFKAYNDNFGHLAGDEVLRRLALILQSCTRAIDIVGRYGGEEFCIVMPNVDVISAQRVGERIRSEVSSTEWPHRSITLSIGLAVLTSDHELLAAFRAADDALYESKRAGRDQLRLAS